MPLPLPRPSVAIQAVLWMLVSSATFACTNAMIQHIGTEVHPFQVVFFRNFFSLMCLMPWVVATRFAVLRTGRVGLYATRSLTSLASMLTWFYGLTVMPLPDATALNFTMPLFAAMGAALFLKEKVRFRRWAAIAAGFIGMLIIVRPGAGSVTADALIVLASCIFSAATTLQVRALAQSDSSFTMVTYMVLFITPMSLGPALMVWSWPSWEMLGWMALVGAVLTLGHLALARAFHLAEASALMPYDYVKLPLTAVIAYLLYGQVMDVWGWIGAGIIAGSSVYVARREAKLARERADDRA